jgi:aminoglycoside/choline kinase family phosphotransferase
MQPEIVQFLEGFLKTNQFQILPLAGDASARRYFRIVVQPQTYVLMCWDPFSDPARYPFLSVQRHFAKNGVTVPEVKEISPSLGLVLLEDLGDLTLERKFWDNQEQRLTWPSYEQAIDELIKIHFVATADRDLICSAFHIAFDTEKLLWEMNYGREHLLETFAQVRLTEAQNQELTNIFLSICESLHKEPKFISHRDYHSRNVMLKYGQVRVIDFQDARLGPIQYDLVSLLQDSYVQLSSESRDHLLDNYLEKAKAYLPADFSREHFDKIYRLQLIQRCFKACGSFSSFYNLRGDRRYLKYIQGTLKTIASQLRELSQYDLFLQILEDHGLTERSYEL